MKIIGIAGGSGSGKSTLAESLGLTIIKQDNFYKNPNSENTNFDHPDSIDFKLIEKCLNEILTTGKTEIPIYDFGTRKRKNETIIIEEDEIIILEGTLIYHFDYIRNLINYKIFIDTPEEIRYNRRLDRDIVERGRTPESVEKQFYQEVAPMHNKFVQTSKEFSDIIVKDNNSSKQLLNKFNELIIILKKVN